MKASLDFDTAATAVFAACCLVFVAVVGVIVWFVGAVVLTAFFYVHNPGPGVIVFDPFGRVTHGDQWVWNKDDYTVEQYDCFHPDPEEFAVVYKSQRLATVSFQWSLFSDEESQHLFFAAHQGGRRWFLEERAKLIEAHYKPDQIARDVIIALMAPGHIDPMGGANGQNVFWWYQSRLDSVIGATGLTPFVVKLDYHTLWDLHGAKEPAVTIDNPLVPAER